MDCNCWSSLWVCGSCWPHCLHLFLVSYTSLEQVMSQLGLIDNKIILCLSGV